MEMGSIEAGWEEVSCLNGRIVLRLPEQLKEQSYEKVEERFPYHSKPQEVRMDEEGKTIFALNLLEKQLEEGQIQTAVREIQRMITHIYPESIRNHARCMKVEAGITGWFSFVTGGLADDNCHIMLLMSVSGKMLLGSYHFPAGQEQEEKENFFKILRSMQIVETGQDKWRKKLYGSRI